MQKSLVLLGTAMCAVAIVVAAWRLRQSPLTMFAPFLPIESDAASGLNLGHAALSLLLLVASVLNRRFGRALTIAGIGFSTACIAVLTLSAQLQLWDNPLLSDDLPAPRSLAAFLCAMSISLTCGAYIFDLTRGVAWWNAPAYGGLTASLLSVPIYFLLAQGETDNQWVGSAVNLLAFGCAASFLMLVPYFFLRPVFRPKEGLGGY